MNVIVCFIATLVVLTTPGDFAANRLFLLLLLFSLALLHHYIKGRPWYYRATEYSLLAAVFLVWAAGFVSPHYFLLQPLINATLTAHAVSAIVFYWPTEEQARKQAYTILWKAFPWFVVAALAQWKAGDWLPAVKRKEMYLPPMQVPTSSTVTVGDTTKKAISVFDSLSKQ